jgi:hypothetical protein
MKADTFYSILRYPALLNDIAETELEEITKQYPWFSAAHFLLAVKKQNQHSPDANTWLQKATVHFINPLWMNWQLQRFQPNIPADMHTNTDQQMVEPVIQTETVMEDETDAALDAAVLTASADQIELHRQEQEMNTELDAEVITEAAASIESERDQREPTISIPKSITKTLQSIQQKQESGEKQDDETVVTFEPYHTVDYFASQGIKLQEDKLGDDKLGKQLKTFTQWLKSMKKIYVEDQQELDAASEKQVVDLAIHSNEPEEIVTETMANVLEQQGKKTQAIELYGKLILLHPEKSGYFAAKIDELKS